MTEIAEVDPLLMEETVARSEEEVNEKVPEDDIEEKIEKESLYHCDFCYFKTVSLTACQIHVFRIHKLRPCKLCHFYADSLPNLNFHQETQHGLDPFSPVGGEKKDILNCGHCDAEFKSNQGLKSHVDNEHNGVRYSCKECDFQTSWRSSLKLHINAKHRGVLYSCQECPFQTGYKKLLNRHRIAGRHLNEKNSTGQKTTRRKTTHPRIQPFGYQKHRFMEIQEGGEDKKKDVKPGQDPHQPDENQLIWCQYADCNFRSKYITNLCRHERSQHRGVKFQCDQCAFTAKQRTEVLVHSNAEHDGIVYSCESCDFKTRWKSFFKKHQIEKHGASSSFSKRQAPYFRVRKNSSYELTNSCPRCDFTSEYINSMNYHVSKTQTGKVFNCDLCDYKNCLERGLRKHKVRVHQQIGSNSTICDKCDHKSTSTLAMKYHIEHSKSEVFSCDLCDYRNCFARGLSKHKARQHKVDPQCPQCDFSSSNKQNLRYHIKKSTTGRLFPCRYCQYKNCFKKSLHKHEIEFHGVSIKKIKGKCPNCDFSAWNDKVLDFHLKQSKLGTVHRCELCDYKNCSERSLTKHKAKKHKITKPRMGPSRLECSKCGKKYHSLNGLKVHKSICLNLTYEEPVESKVMIDSPVEKFCDKCDYKTADIDDYYDHVLEHLPSNTSQPQKLNNSVGNNLNPIRNSVSEEPEIPSQSTGLEEIAGKTVLPVRKDANSITTFKDYLLKKLKKIDSKRTTEEEIEEDEESLEPGEIVRDAEGLIVRDSLLKTEVEEENLPQVPPKSEPDGEPGEIVRDTEGEIVGDSSLKTEVEDQVNSQDMNQDLPENFPQDREELESAVGFLMSLDPQEQDNSSRDENEKAGEDILTPNIEDTEEFKCVFACGDSFCREEDLYIHITDKHNDF